MYVTCGWWLWAAVSTNRLAFQSAPHTPSTTTRQRQNTTLETEKRHPQTLSLSNIYIHRPLSLSLCVTTCFSTRMHRVGSLLRGSRYGLAPQEVLSSSSRKLSTAEDSLLLYVPQPYPFSGSSSLTCFMCHRVRLSPHLPLE